MKYDFTKIKISRNEELEIWELEYGNSGVIAWSGSWRFLDKNTDFHISFYKLQVSILAKKLGIPLN
jgi:hypothetical protein